MSVPTAILLKIAVFLFTYVPFYHSDAILRKEEIFHSIFRKDLSFENWNFIGFFL